jgi:hypothetical protein
MDIQIHDEALFVVPATGALWSYDFGSKKREIHPADSGAHASDPPLQVAQLRVDDRPLLLVFPTLGSPSIAEQATVRALLEGHVGTRGVAFVLDQQPGRMTLIGSDAESVEHFAAAAAVVRTCWGWDESTLFSVIVDELEFTVAPKFDGEVWTARPEAVSRGRSRR